VRHTSPSIISYRVVVSTALLDRRARRGLLLALKEQLSSPPKASGSTTSRSCDVDQTCTMWVPGPILKARLPFLVDGYEARMQALVKTDPPVPVSSLVLRSFHKSLLTRSLDPLTEASPVCR
jgi:hypothetical protein